MKIDLSKEEIIYISKLLELDLEGFNDGCSCCMSETADEALQEALSNKIGKDYIEMVGLELCNKFSFIIDE